MIWIGGHFWRRPPVQDHQNWPKEAAMNYRCFVWAPGSVSGFE